MGRGRRRRKHARAAVVSAVGTLVLLTAGLTALVTVRPGVRDPLFALKRETYAARVSARPAATRVIVLGSSRPAAAVEPKTLAVAAEAETGRPCLAFNMAIGGSGPVAQYVHARRLLAAGPAPDVVVMECLPPQFGRAAAGPWEAAALKSHRLTWDEIDVVARYGFPVGIRDQWLEEMANPWTGFKQQVLSRVRARWCPPGTAVTAAPRDAVEAGDGWGPWDAAPRPPAAARTAKVRGEWEPRLRAVQFDGPVETAFRDTVLLFRAAGVRVVVVAMPESTTFRSWYPAGLDDRVRLFLSGVGREFGVPVVDARGWLPDEAFADWHHVARGAARGFTERLVREAVGPLLLTSDRLAMTDDQ